MMVFYQCYGRSHTSVVAAHIHLGNLPNGALPSVRQIMALPFFDEAEEADFGRPLLFGRDADGHEVYALGLGSGARAGLGAIMSLFALSGASQPLVVDTLKGLGIVARIGGGLSRQFGLVSIGRPLAAYGVRRIYPRLAGTVASVKEFLRRDFASESMSR